MSAPFGECSLRDELRNTSASYRARPNAVDKFLDTLEPVLRAEWEEVLVDKDVSSESIAAGMTRRGFPVATSTMVAIRRARRANRGA